MKKILIIFTSLMCMFSIVGCGKEVQEEEVIISDDSSEISTFADVTIGDLVFHNSLLVAGNDADAVVTLVTNNGQEINEVKEIKIILEDNNGNRITELSGYVENGIGPNETLEIRNFSIENLSKVTNIKYEIVN